MKIKELDESNSDNYQKKVLKLVEDGKIPEGSIGILSIAHDDWCPIKPHCTCDPFIYLNGKRLA